MKKMNESQAQLPKYKCHKEVWALKIKAIEYDSDKAKTENRETDGSAIIIPEDERYAPIKVSHEYVNKHLRNVEPVGGYYVVYEDGYISWSPMKAFEEGYTKIE
jgi:hypothetical protein